MRFLTSSFALASGIESGYNVWDQGCQNDCKTIVTTKQFYEEQGHCYVKNKGIRLILLSFMNVYDLYIYLRNY